MKVNVLFKPKLQDVKIEDVNLDDYLIIVLGVQNPFKFVISKECENLKLQYRSGKIEIVKKELTDFLQELNRKPLTYSINVFKK